MSPEERKRALYEMRIKKPYKRNIKTTSRRNIARYILKSTEDKSKFRNIDEHKFNLVITRIMQLKAEALCKNGYTELDRYLGTIKLVYEDRVVDDYDKLTIDWPQTLDLWLNNPKAKENKTRVRKLEKYFEICFVWSRGEGVRNIEYYSFKPCRTFVRMVYKRYKEKQDITLLMK